MSEIDFIPKRYPLILGPAIVRYKDGVWILKEMHTNLGRTYYSVSKMDTSLRGIVSLDQKHANKISTKDLYLEIINKTLDGRVEF